MKNIKSKLFRPEGYIFLIIVALAFAIQMRSGLFFTNNNIVDILRSMIVPLIYGLCAYLAFISTGADVSFPLIAALSSFLATTIAVNSPVELPMIAIFAIAIFFGMLMGMVNGFILIKFKFPSLMVTLATSSIFSGILLGVFEATRMDLSATMNAFGHSSILSVVNPKTGLGSSLPTAFLIVVGLYGLVYFVLNYTVVGRGVYAIGGDEVSAERAGFKVNRIRFWTFAFSGAIAAIAGLCYTTMNLKFTPNEFAGGEMIVIAAVILGGTRMSGGVGTLTGVIMGTTLLTMVNNSLLLAGIPVYYQKVFIGLFIIVGTALSARKASKAKEAAIESQEKEEVHE